MSRFAVVLIVISFLTVVSLAVGSAQEPEAGPDSQSPRPVEPMHHRMIEMKHRQEEMKLRHMEMQLEAQNLKLREQEMELEEAALELEAEELEMRQEMASVEGREFIPVPEPADAVVAASELLPPERAEAFLSELLPEVEGESLQRIILRELIELNKGLDRLDRVEALLKRLILMD